MPDLQASHIYLLDGLILLALLLCSAIISGTEVAFFSLSHKQITQCKNSKDLRERGVVKLLKNPRRLLATILILNNLVNVAIVTLSTYLLWHVTGSEAVEGIVLFAYTLISTALIVLFGEVIPKIYANQNNLRVAKRLTGPLYVAVPLLYPLSSLLLRLGKLIGRKNQFQEHYDLSAEGLNRALELTTMQETSAGEREILKGVMTFSTLTVKQTMQPRTEIVAIDTTLNFHKLMDLVHKSSYSRFPVYRDTIDSVEGLLYTKDLMPYLDQDERFAWHKLLRKALFVPENKKIDALLLEFQEKRIQMAIVVDEYGGTSGLITMEDII
ncbi:MAG: CNNM domain-containing protein, partial [Bacteroidota bacterium]